MVGDANGAILAYDALCLNHNLDDTTSLYGEGNRSNDFRHVSIVCFGVEGGLPRTPATNKRSPNGNYDTSSGQSTNRLSAKRTTTANDTPDSGDNM